MGERPDVDDELGSLTDGFLAQRAADGDDAAFEVLVRRHGTLMRAYTSRIVGSLSAADDVVQESFIIAWQRLPELRDPSAVKGWLMRIVSRQAFDALRRRPRQTDLSEVAGRVSTSTSPEDAAVHNAGLIALSAALDRLPADQRSCWLLREIGELSYDDIAQELEVPVSSVRGKLARARASIYTDMEGWR